MAVYNRKRADKIEKTLFKDIKLTRDYTSDNYYNRFSFTFPNGSPQGFSCGYGTKDVESKITVEGFKDNYAVDVIGENPGIKSSSFSCGINPDDFVILVKAGLLTSDRGDGAIPPLFLDNFLKPIKQHLTFLFFCL